MDATSIISATGAHGGVTGCKNDTSSSSDGNPTASGKAKTVTVTIALPAGTSVALPPSTRTIGSSEASSILSILAADAKTSPSTATKSSSLPAQTADATHIKLTSSPSTATHSSSAVTKTFTPVKLEST
ncbi:hypothetical protein HWV62_39091 [Athelia sp. TMB]|nr:hypothetical protein HWV62_39091 [Athelia sp. TMB]